MFNKYDSSYAAIHLFISGVASIFSVGGHWGALSFRRGAKQFWAGQAPPPLHPPKKNPHVKRVLIFRRNKLTSKKKKKRKGKLLL